MKSVRIVKSVIVSLVLALCGLAHAQSTTLQGGGATFPKPLYAKWTATFNAANPEVKIDYQPIGSGGGIKGITDRTFQFGGTDGPMTDEQLKTAPAKILHIPTVAGPEVMAYNLPGVANLNLNGEVIAGIFLGQITKWNDPKIAAINAGTALPDKDVVVAHRSDGSGTTWIFTNYLSKVSPEWKKVAGNATAVKWPTGLAGKGNDGVAQIIQGTEGAIGYVELAFAISAKIPYATLINKAGKPVKASIEGVVAAAKSSVSDFPGDMRVSITDAPGDESYPICGFTYFLVYQDLSYLKDKTQVEALMKFVNWCEHDGQELAKDLNYARLPAEVQKKVEDEIKTIVFDGQALVK